MEIQLDELDSKILGIENRKIKNIRNIGHCEESNEEVQLLHFVEEIKSEENILKILGNLSLRNFPNVFIITFANLSVDPESLNFMSLLLKAIGSSREIFIQTNYDNNFKAFYKHKNSEKIEMLTNQTCEHETVDQFFKVLNDRNTLLVDADYCIVFNVSEHEFKNVHLKKVIETKNVPLIKFLALFANNFEDHLLESAIKTQNCDVIISIMNNFSLTQSSNSSIDETRPFLKREILIKIAETGNLKLLNYFQNTHIEFDIWCEMQTKATEGHFHEFSLELHKLESRYDKSLNFVVNVPTLQDLEISFNESCNVEPPLKRMKSNQAEEDRPDMQVLHNFIENRDYNKVKEFIRNFPYFKLCCYEGKSALEKAIDCDDEMYVLLLSEEFLCDKPETLQSKIEKYSDMKRIEKHNQKLLKESPEKCLDILASKCEFFATATKLGIDEMRKVIGNIQNIDGAKVMMSILAQSDVTIAIDLKSKFICWMNPYKTGATGLSVSKNHVVYLANGYSELDREATFIHEMTHYVCNLIYENYELPYCKNDITREEVFEIIYQAMEARYLNGPFDDIIDPVFENYKPEDPVTPEKILRARNDQKCELIARVPEFLTTYRQRNVEMQRVLENCSDLHKFYITKTLKDFEIPNIYQMIKLNNNFGLLERIKLLGYQVATNQDSIILQTNQKRTVFVSKAPQLLLTKIVNEIDETSTNKLDLKAKNIFVQTKKSDLMRYRKELQELVQSSCVKRVLIDTENGLKENLKIFQDLKVMDKWLEVFGDPDAETEFIAVVNEKDTELIESLTKTFRFVRQDVAISWNDLNQESQQKLLKKSVNFQNQEVTVEDLLEDHKNALTTEMLEILCTTNEININSQMSKENWLNFIPRIIEKNKDSNSRKKIDFPTEKFILDTRRAENFQNMVLISDPAGSGKTFLFKNLNDRLKSTENIIQPSDDTKLIFTLFLPLEKHLKELEKGVGDNFVNFIAEISKFDSLTKAVFVQKFNKGETIIFFDAYDEIRPVICRKQTKKLFELFRKEVKSDEQPIINDGNQSSDEETGPDQEMTEEPNEGSRIVLEKNEKRKNQIFISTRTHLEAELKEFGIFANRIKPLTKDEQILFLRIFWQKQDSDQNYSTLIEECAKLAVEKISKIILSVASVIGIPIILCGLAEFYGSKIDQRTIADIENWNVAEIFKKMTIDKLLIYSKVDCKENRIVQESPIQIHQFHAVSHLFEEKTAFDLGLDYDREYWSLDKIASYSLLTYDVSNKISFTHETFAEFLVAHFLFEKFKTANTFHNEQINFSRDFLTNRFKFKLSRIFLDSMLEQVEDYAKLRLFNSSEEICRIIDGNRMIFHQIRDEKLFCIFEFFLMAILKVDQIQFQKYINDEETRKLLFSAKNSEKVEKLLDKIQDAGFFESFVTYEDRLGNNILLSLANYCISRDIFKSFWMKIEKIIEDPEKLENAFTHKGHIRQNVLLLSLKNENDSTIFQFIFNIAFKKIFHGNLEKFESFLCEADKRNKEDCTSVITKAVECGNKENLNFLFNRIERIFGIEKLKEILKFKNELDNNLLTIAALKNSLDVNESLWKLFDEKFSVNEICAILEEKDENLKNFLHKVARHSHSMENFEFWLRKLKEKFVKKENLQKYLLEPNNFDENALISSAENRHLDEIFQFFFEKIYAANFPDLERFIFLLNSKGNNLLHMLAFLGSHSNLKFGLEKLKKILSEEKFVKILTAKNTLGENCFFLVRFNKEKIEILMKFIENNFGREMFRRMLSEADNDNCLVLHKALHHKIVFNFLFFHSIYKQNFSEDEVKQFINIKDMKFYENILFEVKRRFRLKFLKGLKAVLEKYIESEVRIPHIWFNR